MLQMRLKIYIFVYLYICIFVYLYLYTLPEYIGISRDNIVKSKEIENARLEKLDNNSQSVD